MNSVFYILPRYNHKSIRFGDQSINNNWNVKIILADYKSVEREKKKEIILNDALRLFNSKYAVQKLRCTISSVLGNFVAFSTQFFLFFFYRIYFNIEEIVKTDRSIKSMKMFLYCYRENRYNDRGELLFFL